MVDWARACYQMSIKRVCAVLLVQRSSYYYKSRKDDQALLRMRTREIAAVRAGYGYKRIHVTLQREGWGINVKRVYRLYKADGLQMRNKRSRRRIAAKVREDRCIPEAPNDVWAMDFVHDNLFDGQKVRCLTIVDIFSKVSPAIGVAEQYRGCDVAGTLDQAIQAHGTPRQIRVDNGPEFISKDLDLWAYSNNVELDFSRPGKPTDNAFIESFNSRFRQECLNQHWFLDMSDAEAKIAEWWRHYNSGRPHSSIDNLTPFEFVESLSQASLA